MTSLIQHDCSLVSKIDWNSYIFVISDVNVCFHFFKHYFNMCETLASFSPFQLVSLKILLLVANLVSTGS